MLKRGVDSCRLYTLAFHNPDLFFCQPVDLVDQGVYLSIRGPESYSQKAREILKTLDTLEHMELKTVGVIEHMDKSTTKPK